MDQTILELADREVRSVEDIFNEALAAYRQGRFANAVERFAEVLVLLPGFVPALINRALAFWSLGALNDAEIDAIAACAASPEAAEAWMVTGAIRIDRSDASGAAEAYRTAVALRPEMAGAHAGLAASYLAMAHHREAHRQAATALSLDSACNHARFTFGSAQSALGDSLGAIATFDELLAIEPDHAGAHLNRGNALINLDDIAAGETALHTAVTINPALREAWASLGVVRTIRGDTRGAIAACDRAIALDPDFAVAHWNRGVAALLAGDFTEGFAEYEWRKRHPIYGVNFDRFTVPVWQNQPLAGKHLLVRAEQGLGDTIMFARFLPILAKRAAKLTLACNPTLFGLFGGMGIGLCGLQETPPADVDFAIDQMSLPHVLALTPATIPAAAGYLTSSPAKSRQWRAALPPGRVVALVWAGNPEHNNDRRRSLPKGALDPLLALPGINFIALQLGPRQHDYNIPSLALSITDFASTAQILADVDALVTVDTSIAHLAGAMNRPCHILLSASCDWRWLLGRPTTPWYDSISLHRQTRLGDWSGPIASIKAALG